MHAFKQLVSDYMHSFEKALNSLILAFLLGLVGFFFIMKPKLFRDRTLATMCLRQFTCTRQLNVVNDHCLVVSIIGTQVSLGL